jgi:thiosulfate dehydrogenase (quinone) large subunit
VLLSQRLFLGVTFCFAGLQKLLDPAFLDPTALTGIGHQLAAYRQGSPIGPLVALAQHQPELLGVLIAVAEIAVGLATLVGLWTRAAAVVGALLALSFLLTVSWRTRPYYYGADIVFLVAWLPIAVVGAGGVLSLDARRLRRKQRAEPSGRRREFLAGASAATLLVTATGLLSVGAGVIGRNRRHARQSKPSSGPQLIVARASVPEDGALQISDPGNRLPAYVVQPSPGRYAAFSSVCSHAGCTVDFGGDGTFRCPCHGGVFDAATGAVLSGPPPAPLGPLPVTVVGDQLHIGAGPPPPTPAPDVGTHGDD